MQKVAYGELSFAQRAMVEHVATRCARFLVELHIPDHSFSDWRGRFGHFESVHQNRYPTMDAGMVDLPAVAATCDSMSLIPEELAQSICNPDRLFPSANPNGHFSFGAAGPERDEYVKLVLRQLQCGKTKLRREVFAVGDVFCVPKTTPGKQREVWNGAAVSEAAIEPPPRTSSPTQAVLWICFFGRATLSTCQSEMCRLALMC